LAADRHPAAERARGRFEPVRLLNEGGPEWKRVVIPLRASAVTLPVQRRARGPSAATGSGAVALTDPHPRLGRCPPRRYLLP